MHKMGISELSGKLKTFTIEAKRVLAVTRKPTREEFITIVKVTGAGILLIGTIGFLFQITRNLLI